jgi:hypothetical protein
LICKSNLAARTFSFGRLAHETRCTPEQEGTPAAADTRIGAAFRATCAANAEALARGL